MYGDKANYPGYMSKFLSSYPFTFSISQVAYTKVYEFIEQKCNIRRDEMRKFMFGNVNLGGISFDQFLHKLSVRDIAHALDGIESQLTPDDKIQFKGIEYSVDIPIFWLIALLKRLRGNISVSLVQTGLLCLEAEIILNTLGVMLLGSNINPGSLFSFRNNIFCAVLDDTNTGKKCLFKKNVIPPDINVNMDQAIRHAISESFKHVVDVEVE
jgi:hypothetical protein